MCFAAAPPHRVDELHGLGELRDGLQGGQHGAGLHSQELAGRDRELWRRRPLGDLGAPPGPPLCLLLQAAAAGGHGVVRHVVGPGREALQTLKVGDEKDGGVRPLSAAAELL